MTLYQILRICLPQDDLKLVRFLRVSNNSCCHSNASITFSLLLSNSLIFLIKRGTIKLMLLQLHFYLLLAEGRGWETMKCLPYVWGVHAFMCTFVKFSHKSHSFMKVSSPNLQRMFWLLNHVCKKICSH